MKRFLARFLVVWLIATLVFMSFAAVLMDPWRQEKEPAYSVYLPPLSTVPTRADQQDLAFRWFHRLDVEELRKEDFEKFKALNLLYYDYDISTWRQSFRVTYLGLADDGKVYHATTGGEWFKPYRISSHILEGDQLQFRLERDNSGVFFGLLAALLAGLIPALLAAWPLYIHYIKSKKRFYGPVF